MLCAPVTGTLSFHQGCANVARLVKHTRLDLSILACMRMMAGVTTFDEFGAGRILVAVLCAQLAVPPFGSQRRMVNMPAAAQNITNNH